MNWFIAKKFNLGHNWLQVDTVQMGYQVDSC